MSNKQHETINSTLRTCVLYSKTFLWNCFLQNGKVQECFLAEGVAWEQMFPARYRRLGDYTIVSCEDLPVSSNLNLQSLEDRNKRVSTEIPQNHKLPLQRVGSPTLYYK